jgi:hypothetical protein
MDENTDQKHLKLIAIFHFIVGGIGVLFACLPLIHLGMGIALMTGYFPEANNGDQPPEWLGLLFAIMGGVFFLVAQAMAWSIIYSGFQIKKRAHYTLSFIIACIMCILVPLGTVLGVFTIIVLSRESVKKLYEKTF